MGECAARKMIGKTYQDLARFQLDADQQRIHLPPIGTVLPSYPLTGVTTMLDFSRVTDFLTEMAGNVLQGTSADPQGLTELLANAGLDPSALAGLSEGEIMTLLSDHGIDLSQFAPEELTNFMNSLGLGDGANLLQRLFDESRHG
jgi:hypothetical protein